jgi:hypothetical protein
MAAPKVRVEGAEAEADGVSSRGNWSFDSLGEGFHMNTGIVSSQHHFFLVNDIELCETPDGVMIIMIIIIIMIIRTWSFFHSYRQGMSSQLMNACSIKFQLRKGSAASAAAGLL